LKFGISDKGYIDLEITEALVKLQTFPKGDQVSRDGEEFPTGNRVSSDAEKFPTGNRVSSDAEKFPTGNRVSSDAREFPTVPSSYLYHFSLFASQRMQAWQAFERGCLSWI